MTGLTYDTGALIAAEKNERRMWGIHARALARGVRPVVPAGVLTEAYRSSKQTNLTRLLVACVIEPLDGNTARTSGALLGQCSINVGAVDASVVEGALRRGDAVVTSDPDHLAASADSIGRKLNLITPA